MLSALNPSSPVSDNGASTRELRERVANIDVEADHIIRNWSFGALALNLLPPPFDAMTIGAAFGRMGYRLAAVYGVPIRWPVIKNLGMSMAKGVLAVSTASYLGTAALKWIPGVNVTVALLVQPPIVAYITHTVGHAFKTYFHLRIMEGHELTPDELRNLAESMLREKLSGNVVSSLDTQSLDSLQ